MSPRGDEGTINDAKDSSCFVDDLWGFRESLTRFRWILSLSLWTLRSITHVTTLYNLHFNK